VDEPWPLKEEAKRIFKLADLDKNGCLNEEELKAALKNPQFVGTAMENLDTNMDGKVSLREWLISMKSLYDKSEAACKTALKAHEKGVCVPVSCCIHSPRSMLVTMRLIF